METHFTEFLIHQILAKEYSSSAFNKALKKAIRWFSVGMFRLSPISSTFLVIGSSIFTVLVFEEYS